MKASESLQNDQSTATENALRRAVDTTPAFIHTARPDGYLDYFNRGWLDFFGKSLEEVCGWRWTESVHPEDVDGIVQKWRAALASGEPFEIEARVRRADGTYRALLHRKLPLRDEHGNIVKWFGSSSDIEDRKRAEEELRNSEQKYRDLVDTTPAFVHTNLPNGDLDFVNRGWLEYLGLSNTDLLGSRWTSAIHPEDVEELVAKWRAAFESGEGYVAEARVRRADGEYRWFLHREEPLRNEAGEIVKWYGSAIEIQERKIAEQRIREQETELRQILDLTPQHHGVLAPDGSRLYANHTALEYFGITLEQWREPGRVLKFTRSPGRSRTLPF